MFRKNFLLILILFGAGVLSCFAVESNAERYLIDGNRFYQDYLATKNKAFLDDAYLNYYKSVEISPTSSGYLGMGIVLLEKQMNRKAKKNTNMFTKGMVWRVIYQGIMIGGLTLLAFGIGCGFNFAVLETDPVVAMRAQTMAFSVLALSELVHVFNLRSKSESMFKVGWLTNKVLLGAIGISASLMIIVLAIPGLREIFKELLS